MTYSRTRWHLTPSFTCTHPCPLSSPSLCLPSDLLPNFGERIRRWHGLSLSLSLSPVTSSLTPAAAWRLQADPTATMANPARYVLLLLLHLRQGDGDVRFKITIDLVGERHTDPASYHKDPNSATLAPHLLWLSTVSHSG
jgi:hypothetical protein